MLFLVKLLWGPTFLAYGSRDEEAQSLAPRSADCSWKLRPLENMAIILHAEVMVSSSSMALIALLRGVNVGGYRTFRPSILARALSDYDVVNVGAAGTLIVRKPGSRAKFLAELLRQLPFATEVALCDGRDLTRLESENPFGAEPARPDIVRFVSILSRAGDHTQLEHNSCSCADFEELSHVIIGGSRRQ